METIVKIITKALVGLIRIYRTFVSPVMGPRCRHIPSCSEYALDAIKKRGIISGVLLTSKRILRCRPGGTSGYDPVPDKKEGLSE
ncbi:MAG: membrane protein insertion efficiency factor YidD [Pelagibacterales bacterium]|nr:membrane protein insertion efficiency factor YidD [Pelagibacterales bacterium]